MGRQPHAGSALPADAKDHQRQLLGGEDAPQRQQTADAAIKIATARQEFASTDTFLEMIGFDQADILRIKAQEQRVRGQKTLLEVENEDNGDGLGGVHPAAGEAE